MPKRWRSGCIAAFYKSYSTHSPAPRHGYCVAQHIRQTTESVLRVEEYGGSHRVSEPLS